MSNDFRNNSGMNDHLLKQVRLCANASIKANATPASKVHASDVPGGIYLRTQGKIAESDAIESLVGIVTAPDDATGKFAVLIDEPNVDKLYLKSVTASAGTIAVAAAAVSAGGRLYLDLDSSLDLSAADLTITIEMSYKKKK